MCGRGVPQEAHSRHQAEDQTEVDLLNWFHFRIELLSYVGYECWWEKGANYRERNVSMVELIYFTKERAWKNSLYNLGDSKLRRLWTVVALSKRRARISYGLTEWKMRHKYEAPQTVHRAFITPTQNTLQLSLLPSLKYWQWCNKD